MLQALAPEWRKLNGIVLAVHLFSHCASAQLTLVDESYHVSDTSNEEKEGYDEGEVEGESLVHDIDDS